MTDPQQHVSDAIEEILRELVPDALCQAESAWLDTRFDSFFPTAAERTRFVERVKAGLGEGAADWDALAAMTPRDLIAKLCPLELAKAEEIALVTAAPPTVGPHPTATVVRMFYATDRQAAPDAQLGTVFGPERSPGGALNFGECEVSIPAVHKVGRLESPSILRLEFRPDPERHIVLTQTNSLEEELFFTRVSSAVQSSPGKDVFILVHGYNVTFEDAARRTGQFAFDLSFVGAPIFYSWPANGHVLDYSADEANIIWTAPHLERFIGLIARRSGAQKIHLIAHSMGNRAVCDALKSLMQGRVDGQGVLLNQLVLAAPDIDADTFRELAAAVTALSRRVTLYESSKDKALLLSKQLHKNLRAGEPLLIVPGMDTIDASEMQTDFLAHSYFSDTWPLLSDIHALISDDAAPAARFGLREETGAAGIYYAFRPSH